MVIGVLARNRPAVGGGIVLHQVVGHHVPLAPGGVVGCGRLDVVLEIAGTI